MIAHFQGCLALLLAGLLLIVVLVVIAFEGGGQGNMRRTQAQHVEKRRQGPVEQILGGVALLATGAPPCCSLLPLVGNGKKRQFRVAVGKDEIAHPLLHQRVTGPLWVGGQAHDAEIFAAQKGDALAAVRRHLSQVQEIIFHKGQEVSGKLQLSAGPPFVQ